MTPGNESDIVEIRRSVEDTLFKKAQTEWETEKASNYRRIKLFGNPASLAFLRSIAPLSSSECDRLLSILPKRSYVFLKEAVPGFFPPEEQSIVDDFVRRFSRLAMPFFPENQNITNIWEEHDKLAKSSRDGAIEIERFLIARLKDLHEEWDGYVYAEPEPHVVSYEKRHGELRIIVDFEFRNWEFFCGVKLFRENGLSLLSNYTFLGSLGISSPPAWYTDETSASQALTVCADHAMQSARAVAVVLEKMTNDK